MDHVTETVCSKYELFLNNIAMSYKDPDLKKIKLFNLDVRELTYEWYKQPVTRWNLLITIKHVDEETSGMHHAIRFTFDSREAAEELRSLIYVNVGETGHKIPPCRRDWLIFTVKFYERYKKHIDPFDYIALRSKPIDFINWFGPL